MHYTYETSTPGNNSWIRNVHKVSNLESTYAALFTEVHVTIPKQPGDEKNFTALPHITIVTTKAYRYHWYIWNRKISDKKRTEQIGIGNKVKSDSWTSSEKELVERVLKDVKEQAWC